MYVHVRYIHVYMLMFDTYTDGGYGASTPAKSDALQYMSKQPPIEMTPTDAMISAFMMPTIDRLSLSISVPPSTVPITPAGTTSAPASKRAFY